MSKNRQHRNPAAEQVEAMAEDLTSANPTGVETVETAVVTGLHNFTLTFSDTHPQARATYKVEGQPGRVVLPQSLMLGGEAADFAWPETLTISIPLVSPKAKVEKADKEAAKAAKLLEKAAKAQAKIEAAQAKAEERQAKAAEALAKAQARIADAQAKVEAKAAELVDA